MLSSLLRTLLLSSLAVAGLFSAGCATQRPVVTLPYQMPALGNGTTAISSRTADIAQVDDSREDRSLDMFLDEPPTQFLRKALAAELVAGGAFAHVGTTVESSAGSVLITANLKELSWAVPNHKGMVKTAFWTSFLTGGIGGLAYGATDTPVYGHAVIALKFTDRATGQIILDQTFDALHEEHTAKLKCDSLETRARVMAAALKAVLLKVTQSTAKPVVPAPSL